LTEINADCWDTLPVLRRSGLLWWRDRAGRVSETARQALALGLDDGRLTIQEFEALCPGVNRRTLQRDLKSLVDKGLLVERGSGPTDPTRQYRLAEAILGARREL